MPKNDSMEELLSILSRICHSWEKDVFECLLKIRDDVFTLQASVFFRDTTKPPAPLTIAISKKRLDSNLQYLRDIGLVEFSEPGVYKKLWV